jgi:hypothetical protein
MVSLNDGTDFGKSHGALTDRVLGRMTVVRGEGSEVRVAKR